MSEEFNNFRRYFGFRFIPKTEFWIDRERTPGEEDFVVDRPAPENEIPMKSLIAGDRAGLKALSKRRRQ